jgi:hypothetical protein
MRKPTGNVDDETLAVEPDQRGRAFVRTSGPLARALTIPSNAAR